MFLTYQSPWSGDGIGGYYHITLLELHGDNMPFYGANHG
jgi:hypothetical protein